MERREALQRLMAVAAAPLIAGCGVDRIFRPELASSATGPIRLIGAGDMHANKDAIGARHRTAGLVKSVLDQNPSARAFAVGDLTHRGTEAEYPFYDSTWGQFKDRTLFCIGNHDAHYADPPAAAYYAYTRAPRYYAQNLGDHWRAYSLNCESLSNGGVDAAEQIAWLKADLAQHPNRRVMAFAHYPLFSSICELHKNAMTLPWKVKPMWQALQAHGGAEFFVSGHAHRFEHLRRKLVDGTVSEKGIRQFVCGTGGVATQGIISRHPDSEKIVVEKGVVLFDLYPDYYEWTFTSESGVVRDTGTQACRKVLA
jgi:3',5'-cyclic AMP phosphodiesterase CpdA